MMWADYCKRKHGKCNYIMQRWQRWHCCMSTSFISDRDNSSYFGIQWIRWCVEAGKLITVQHKQRWMLRGGWSRALNLLTMIQYVTSVGKKAFQKKGFLKTSQNSVSNFASILDLKTCKWRHWVELIRIRWLFQMSLWTQTWCLCSKTYNLHRGLPGFTVRAGCWRAISVLFFGKQQIVLQAGTSTHLRDRNGEDIGHQD